MHETADDLRALQRLIDDSHRSGGRHLRTIYSDERRLSAHDLSQLLRGVQVLNVATVTARCEPRVAPVDGLFFRGRWYFGSSPDSVRFRHLRARPQVSATHVRGEDLAVVVHGTVTLVDPDASEHAEFRGYLRETYPGWDSWARGNPYARIDASKMFTFGGIKETSDHGDDG